MNEDILSKIPRVMFTTRKDGYSTINDKCVKDVLIECRKGFEKLKSKWNELNGPEF
jgi:hypothetical protein